MSDEDKGFAARWSRRKATAREGDQPEAGLDTPAPDIKASNAKVSGTEVSDTETLDTETKELLNEEDFDDVDFEALDKSSDYTRFIQANVPAAIQQKALRKLWASDSVFEVLDGMNDYDEDFTGNGLAGKALKTAYKVGRGFLKDENQEVKSSEVDQVSDAEIVRQNEKGESEAPEEISTPPADSIKDV